MRGGLNCSSVVQSDCGRMTRYSEVVPKGLSAMNLQAADDPRSTAYP